MYVKFKKEHPVGIDKGVCRKLDNATALEFIEGNYVEEIKEEEYNAWREKFYADEKANATKVMSDAVKSNDGRTDAPKENEDGAMTKGKKKRYHKLTKADCEVNKEFLGDLNAGDSVLLDKNGDLALDGRNKLIKKGNA